MVNNNNQTRGWRQYFSLFLLVALIGYLISNGATIAGFYAGVTTTTIIGCIGAALVTICSIYANKRVLARDGEALERQISNQIGVNLVQQQNELGRFGQLDRLANANIAANTFSTFAVLARLLPPMQPNEQGKFSEVQTGVLVTIAALSTATLLLNFTYSTVISGRNTALTTRLNDLRNQPVPQAALPVPAPQ